jgi:hypothetical protein
MKNNLLEINFLHNIIEKCNQRILELRDEIQNCQYKEKQPKHIVLKQQINSFIKKREKAKKTFDNLLQIK